jgi:hypothetical protein
VLVWVAGLQFLALIIQAVVFVFTLSATKKAANAAKEAVDALPIVERAYIYPIVISTGVITEFISNVFYQAPAENDTPVPETIEIIFRIKNYGKTPAILKSAYARLSILLFRDQIEISIPEAILGSMETTGELITRMPIELTRNQASQILVYHAILCFYGTIIFNDIWGNELSTEFTFAWDKDIQRMTLRGIETKTKKKSN